MGKIAKGFNNINFTIPYGNYFYIIIENFPRKFSPCAFDRQWQMVKNDVSDHCDCGNEDLSSR